MRRGSHAWRAKRDFPFSDPFAPSGFMDYASFVDYFPETEVLIFEESDLSGAGLFSIDRAMMPLEGFSWGSPNEAVKKA